MDRIRSLQFLSARSLRVLSSHVVLWPLWACSSSSGGAAPIADAGAESQGPIEDGGVPGLDSGGATSEANTDTESGATPDDGPDQCNGASIADGGTCPAQAPSGVDVLGSSFSNAGGTVVYGTAPDLWEAYPIASPGQAAPTWAPGAGSFSISATLTHASAGPAYAGVGLTTKGARCVDLSNYIGIKFTVAGNLGSCSLVIDAITSGDEAASADSCRGTCSPVAPAACVAASTTIDQTGPVTVPFMSFVGGSPTYAADTARLIGFRWKLETPNTDAGAGCMGSVSISELQLVP